MKLIQRKKNCEGCKKEIIGHFNLKFCPKCRKEQAKKWSKKFYWKDPKKRYEVNKKWIAEHPGYYSKRYHERLKRKGYREKLNERVRNFMTRKREEALIHYGGNPPKCACCSDSHKEFLTIDHINNDGAKHRKEIKGCNLPAWLYRNKYPKGFQILCFNCNEAKKIYGNCPHKN